jgi:hypothetical protein
MDSDELTTEQAAQMHRSLFRLANYLNRVVKRMERTGFPPNDPIFLSARRAYDAISTFCMDLHYLSCQEWRRQARAKAEARTARDRTLTRIRMRCNLAIAIVLLAAGPTRGAALHYQITGEVVKIADGDTLTVLDRSNTQHKIRLAGIDAP